jgi:Family of unknown function (DUF6505)
MRFLRTIRLDQSDERVFSNVAQPGEWAVSGGFTFADDDPAILTGKHRQAFAHGFLGITSFGWSTFAAVAEIGFVDYENVVEALAQHLRARFGAPDIAAARTAAREETEFAANLCSHPINTLIAVERSWGPQGIVERFRAVEMPRPLLHATIWKIEGEDGDDG